MSTTTVMTMAVIIDHVKHYSYMLFLLTPVQVFLNQKRNVLVVVVGRQKGVAALLVRLSRAMRRRGVILIAAFVESASVQRCEMVGFALPVRQNLLLQADREERDGTLQDDHQQWPSAQWCAHGRARMCSKNVVKDPKGNGPETYTGDSAARLTVRRIPADVNIRVCVRYQHCAYDIFLFNGTCLR